MSALTDALAACIQIHENQQALADPVTMAYNAEIAFKKAVLDAISALENVAPAGDVPAQPDAPALVALEAQNAELAAKVQAGEAALAAFDAVLHPATVGNVSSTSSQNLSGVPSTATQAESQPTSVVSAAAEVAPTIAPTTGA